jgi:hypothetical protein
VVDRASNQLLIFFGVGDGTLWSNFTSYTTGSTPYVVRSADFNGDLKLDLVVGNSASNSISVFIGTGMGTLVDLAVSSETGNSFSVYLGNGNGTFQQGINYSSMGTSLQSVIAQDFNEDGLYDLAVTNGGSNTLAILLTECI